MSMYKTIFVTDQGESAGENRFQVDGSVAITTAYASLEAAVGAISSTEANANAIVVKVASGKYDSFTVVKNGEVTVNQSTNFVAVNFGGTTTTVDGEEITVAAVPATLDQTAVLDDLNKNVATGSYYIAAEDAMADVLAPTLYVGMVGDQYAVVSNTEVAKAPNLDSLFEILNNIAGKENAATLTVDPAYTDKTEGYGDTKFSSFTAALQKAAESDEYNHIKVAGSLDEIMPTDIEFIVNNNIVIDADKPVTVNLKNDGTSYDLVLNSNNNNTITFGANVTLKLDDRIIWSGYYGNNVDVVIKGTVSAYQWWNGTDTTVEVGGKLITSGEAMVLRRGATLTVNGDAAQGAAEADRTVQLDANYFSMLSGNLVANDTLIKSGAVWVGNTGGYANEGGVAIKLNNTILNSSGNLKLESNKSATLTLTNGSVLNIKDTNGYGVSIIDANSALNVTDGSSATVNKGINNTGSINVSDGVLTVNGTVDNKGSFIVSGESTLNIDKITNTDDDATRLQVADGTILVNSNIGGYAHLQGDLTVKGGLTVDKLRGGYADENGDVNRITSTISGDKITVTSNANLQNGNYVITADMAVGSHFYLGDNDGKVDIYSDLTAGGSAQTTNGAFWINGDVTLKDGATMTATAAQGNIVFANEGASLTIEKGAEASAYQLYDSSSEKYGYTLNVGGELTATDKISGYSELNLNGGTIVADAVNNANKDGFNVSGESTLNIGTLTGENVKFRDGAIIKDSKIGGEVFVAGNVTFRGDNDFAMIYDYGTLTDYYDTTAPMAWTVEAGASVSLHTGSNGNRYGLGYGDKVVINGEIAAGGAAAARETLDDDDAANDVKRSLYMEGLVAQESKGWNCDSSFTVNNAYVTIGNASSFGNKSGNYGGNYTFSFNNAVLDASRITFYEALSKTTFTFTNSDAKIGQFMTRDKDSVFTLVKSNVVSTALSSGNDEGNYNAATLNITRGSSLTYSSKMFNEEGGTINVSSSTFKAPEIDNNGTLTVTGKSTFLFDTLNSSKLIAFGDMDADRTTLSLGSASGEGMTINSKRINLYNADVTLTDNINAELGNDFLYFKEATLDLNGKELNLNTGKMILNGIDIKGTGTINAIDSNDPVCVQNLTANIGEGVTFNAHTFHAYADTNVAGDLNVTNTILVGVDGIDPADNKTPWIDNADMTVTGSLSAKNMEVRGAKGEVVASKLIVDGGEVNVAGTLTNKGEMTVSNGTLIANKVVTGGTNVNGDVVREGGDIVVSGSSTVKVDSLAGNIYIADGTTLNNSVISTDINTKGETVLLGSVTFNGDTSIKSLAADYALTAGGTITITDTLTITRGMTLGAAPGNDFVVNGGTIVLENTAAADGTDKLYSFVVAYGTATLNSNIVVNGAGDKDGAPIQFQMADVYINSTITQLDQTHSGNVVRVQNSNVYLNATGVINSNVTVTTPWASWNGHDRGVLTLAGGTINGNVNVDSKSELNLTNKGGVVTGTITASSLTLDAGDILTVGALDVDNLTIAIGSSLTITGEQSASDIGTITIVGELVPENAEFTLVTTGWNTLGETTVMYKGEVYTIGTVGANSILFTVENGDLYVGKSNAANAGIYIGEMPDGLSKGDKVTVLVNGAEQTYTYGVDAFATADDAAAATNKDAVTTVTINDDYSNDTDKLATLKTSFANINTIIVSKSGKVVDASSVSINGDLTIDNDGHLDAKITAGGSMTISNSSPNTLLGSYVAEGDGATVTIDNAGGMIGNAADDVDTILGANGGVFVTSGDAADVTVNSGLLELTDTNSFGLDTNSSIFTEDSAAIQLNGSANLSIDGALTDTAVGITGVDHTGTLTLNGAQTYSGDIAANKIEVSNGSNVTFNGNTVNFNELNIAGKLSADFDSMYNYTEAGKVTGAGTLNVTNDTDWIINDSVSRDFSGFTGSVTMGSTGGIVMGMGDATAADEAEAKKSYFADGVNMTVDGGQNVYLAGDGVDTGIKFTGNGTINIGEYAAAALVDGSDNFTQTLSGDNSGFSGTINVSEGAQLTIENALGATAINMDYNGNANATGADDDTQLNLNKDGLTLNAKITGDANDVINVMQNATLKATEALNSFSGKVDIADTKTLNLNGTNTTAAQFVGSENTTINVNANQVFTANNESFTGTVNLNSNLELRGNLSTEGKGVINFLKNNVYLDGGSSTDVAVVGSKLVSKEGVTGEKVRLGNSTITLSSDGALDQFDGAIRINGGTLNLLGDNVTKATFESVNYSTSGKVVLDGGNLELTANDALMEYDGVINVTDQTLTLSGTNNTTALFAGDTAGNVVIAANTTMRGTTLDGFSAIGSNALKDFAGTVTINSGKELILQSTGATAATFASGDTSAKLTINANAEFNAVGGALTNYDGIVWVNDGKTLKLSTSNTTDATLDGSGTIHAAADQNFSNTSEFSGIYQIDAAKTVTLSGTLADTINANGGTLTLANSVDQDVTIKAYKTGWYADTLTNLNFGGNDITLAQGNFVNVEGTGSVKFSAAPNKHTDNNFDKLVAGTVYLTDGRNIEATEFDGNIDITISAADDIADVITSSKFSDIITVTITNDSLITGNDYELIKAAGGYGVDYIKLYDGTQFVDLKLNDGAKANGFTYTLRETADKTWILNQLAGASNFVVVNAAWSGKIPFQQVWDVAADGTPVDRSFGFDAASDLKGAVDYIRGWNIGQGWDNGNLQYGDAKIELTAGSYSLTSGTLMTAENEVTQLTLAAREGEAARISGTVLGSDGSKATTLTIDDVQISGNLAAGGKLVIDNTDAARSTGTYIAGGVTAGTVGATSVAIKGGDFANRFIIGGSYVASGKAVTMTGDTSVTVTNATISGNIYGGSYIAGTAVRTAGNTSVTVDASQNVVIRGNIYAGDYTTSAGSLTGQAGTATVTFTGAADKLTFTGTVNGSDTAAESSLVFSDFAGTFNGSIKGFDKIVISGDTQLALGRRQANAAETDVWFTVTADTTAGEAMYTVRDQNRWEFDDVISIDVAIGSAGEYVLVDNYVGGYEGFTITLNGTAYTIGNTQTINGRDCTLTVEDDQLILNVAVNTANALTSVDDPAKVVTGAASIVDSNVSAVKGTYSSFMDATISGTSTVGTINSNYTGADAVTFADNAKVTVTSGASDGTAVFTGAGNDTVTIGKNAKVEITTGTMNLGAGDDTLTVGEGASLILSGNQKSISAGGGIDTLVLEQGSSVTAQKVNDFESITMDVDSVLNNQAHWHYSPVTNLNLNVTGVTDLVLNGASVAGAKSICTSIGSTQKALMVDGVNMTLSLPGTQTAGMATTGDNKPAYDDDLWTSIGEAKQISGADTAATDDDVWASLNKVDNNLVVAWGRSEGEVGAALEAFQDNDTLVFGEAVVANAADLADGAQATDFDNKKSNGQLA